MLKTFWRVTLNMFSTMVWTFYVSYIAFLYCLRETNSGSCNWDSSGWLCQLSLSRYFQRNKQSCHHPTLSTFAKWALFDLIPSSRTFLSQKSCAVTHPFDDQSKSQSKKSSICSKAFWQIPLCNNHHCNQDVEHFHYPQKLPVSF